MVHRAVVRRHNSIGSFLSDGCLLIPFQFVGTNYLWGPGAASGATVAMHQNQWCSATYKTLLQRCSSRPVFFNALHFSFLLPVPALSGGRRPLLGVTAVTAVYSGPSRRGGGRWRPGATCSHDHTRTGGIMQHEAHIERAREEEGRSVTARMAASHGRVEWLVEWPRRGKSVRG